MTKIAPAKPGRAVEIAVVTKTYSGQEGERVHAGTKFAVGVDRHGLKTISRGRYDQLFQNKLVRPLGEEDTAAAPERARYGEGFTEEKAGEGTGVKTGRQVRQSARNRAKQPDAPPAPQPLARPGSKTGAGAPSQSSPEAQASGASTPRPRGNRRGSASSPSTTPGR